MHTSPGKGAVVALVIFLAIVSAILVALHFLGMLILAIAFLGLFLFLGIVGAVFLIGLLFILLGPYYMLTKTPTVEQGGDYRIDNIEGKEDWPKTE